MGAKKILTDFYNLPVRKQGVTPPEMPLEPKAVFDFLEKFAPGKVSEKKFNEWFDTGTAFEFYKDWVNTHNIVMSYIHSPGIGKTNWEWVTNSLRNAATMPIIPDAEQNDWIELQENSIVLSPQKVHGLNIANEIYKPLYQELLNLLMGKSDMQRCTANDCGNIFYERSNKNFCSPQCRSRIHKRKKRGQNK